MTPPVLAFTQGDPAGIGPELLLAALDHPQIYRTWRPLLIAERSAFEVLTVGRPTVDRPALRYFDAAQGQNPTRQQLEESWARRQMPVLDPVAEPRTITPGCPRAADAAAALAALDLAIGLVAGSPACASPLADALITAPLSKAEIARHRLPDFRGHTDYLAQAAGLGRYGRDYLMAFLAPDLRVALLSTHLPLSEALAAVRPAAVLDALRCLHRHLPTTSRIAVAGLNPHAGEGGLLGFEDDLYVGPAIAAARREGIDAHGPLSADSLFARAQRGEFDWVLALYHDQGLIAVKTAAFGAATNWTLGLPYLRASVDHGTAYDIAGQGAADASSLRAVLETTLGLIAERARPISG